jgi:Tfp pilus assembly protein PilE
MHLFFIPATKNNTGITLVEILIGIVVSGIIVASMYGSFQVVNNTFQNSNAQS